MAYRVEKARSGKSRASIDFMPWLRSTKLSPEPLAIVGSSSSGGTPLRRPIAIASASAAGFWNTSLLFRVLVAWPRGGDRLRGGHAFGGQARKRLRAEVVRQHCPSGAAGQVAAHRLTHHAEPDEAKRGDRPQVVEISRHSWPPRAARRSLDCV